MKLTKNYGKKKMDEIYFFDTYALIEIIKGNRNYEKYKDCRIIISIFNLVELHYAILKISGSIAERVLEEYASCVIKTGTDIIKEANIFKIKNRKSKLSASDCIGYITAKKLNIKFLTGDKEFKYFENAEFVK